jgi:hypothetical protein
MISHQLEHVQPEFEIRATQEVVATDHSSRQLPEHPSVNALVHMTNLVLSLYGGQPPDLRACHRAVKSLGWEHNRTHINSWRWSIFSTRRHTMVPYATDANGHVISSSRYLHMHIRYACGLRGRASCLTANGSSQ